MCALEGGVLSFGEFICSDWCVNHSLKSNQFVGRPVEQEEEEGEKRFDRFPCIPVAVCFSYFGSVVGRESLANHDQIPKKA